MTGSDPAGPTAAVLVAVVGGVLALVVLVAAAAASAVAVAVPGGGFGGSGEPSATALSDIPPELLTHYRQAAAACPGLPWTVLAAIGDVESDHGRSTLPGVRSGENPFHAAGPMQIIPSTWDAVIARHRIPSGGAVPPSRYNSHDAIWAAAFLLCDSGAATDLRGAILAYNHSTSYADDVLARADRYHDTPPAPGPDGADEADAGDGGDGGDEGGRWPAESATVPDLTVAGGRITPRMSTLYHALHDSGATRGGATCWDPHPQNPTSDHPRGRACDIFFRPDDPVDVARGWQIARQLTATHAGYGIHFVIWQGRIWSAERPTWETYRSTIYGCPNRANVTGCHFDHIHVSVY